MPGLAARIERWRQLVQGWPGTSIPAGTPPATPFPEAPLDISVAIRVDDSWIDITPFVYGQERADIQITRGRPNEAGQVDRSRAMFELNNRDGQFSPRNPTSWLYGKIGRNTQVRVAVGADVRFSGEVSEWPQRWDTTGTDVWVPVEASGILRRLTQGATPLKSAMYRGITSLAIQPKAYWPCEEGEDATVIASGIGGPAMAISGPGSTGFAANSGFKCSSPIPTFSLTQWSGQVPDYTGTGNIQVRFLMQVPAAGSLDAQGICAIYATGTAPEWRLLYEAGAGGDLTVQAYDSDGTQLFTQTADFNIDGDLVLVSIRLEQNGADVIWTLQTLQVGAIAATQMSNTLAGRTISKCLSVLMNGGADHDTIAVGHIAVHSEITNTLDLLDQLNAYTGETAGRRLQRLCTEEGVTFRGIGDLNATARMGFELPRKLVEVLQEAADADGGILYEPRDQFGLAYRTRESLYRQDAGLALDYSAAHLSGIEPVDDDQLVRNDITTKRIDGSLFRVVEETGPLSILAPPGGVGTYDEEVSLSLASDGQLPDQAGWRLHLGTVDEARYPVLSVDLARPVFAASAPLAEAVRHLDIGDRLTIANPPAWLPPETITQLAQGFTEVMAQFTHRIAVNCSPESPWGQVGVYEDGTTRYDSGATTLAEDLDATETGVDVAIAGGPLWTHDDGDFDIIVGGERMTVTGVAGGSSPQTFTAARSVNGVAKTHASGAEVALFHPSVYVP